MCKLNIYTSFNIYIYKYYYILHDDQMMFNVIAET